MRGGPTAQQLTRSDRVDAVLLHPLWGWVCFLGVMFAVFWSIFSFAEYPDGLDRIGGRGWLGGAIEGAMAEGDLRDLLVDGVIERRRRRAGVPAADPAAVPVHRPAGKLRLHGAGRLPDGRRDGQGRAERQGLPAAAQLLRLRDPGHHGHPHHRLGQGTADHHLRRAVDELLGAAAGLLPAGPAAARPRGGPLAAGAGAVLRLRGRHADRAASWRASCAARLGPDETTQHFLLELPPYRAPQWGYILRHVADRGWSFLRKAGTIILGLSILLWALKTYPKSDSDDPAEQLAHSAMGRLGAVIEPVVKPLGFDGRTGTAILTSFAAREVFVSSMAIGFRRRRERRRGGDPRHAARAAAQARPGPTARRCSRR